MCNTLSEIINNVMHNSDNVHDYQFRSHFGSIFVLLICYRVMFAFLCTPLRVQQLRGGWRQRERQVALMPAERPRPPARQTMSLLRQLGDGQLSSAQVVEIVWQDVEDRETTHPMKHRIASLYSPTHVGCAHKLLQLLVDGGVSAPIVDIPSDMFTHFVSPYRLIQVLASTYPEKLEALFGLDEMALSTCWCRMLQAGHPGVAGVGDTDWRRCVCRFVFMKMEPRSRNRREVL